MSKPYQNIIERFKNIEIYTGYNKDPNKLPSLYERIESINNKIINIEKKCNECCDGTKNLFDIKTRQIIDLKSHLNQAVGNQAQYDSFKASFIFELTSNDYMKVGSFYLGTHNDYANSSRDYIISYDKPLSIYGIDDINNIKNICSWTNTTDFQHMGLSGYNKSAYMFSTINDIKGRSGFDISLLLQDSLSTYDESYIKFGKSSGTSFATIIDYDHKIKMKKIFIKIFIYCMRGYDRPDNTMISNFSISIYCKSNINIKVHQLDYSSNEMIPN